MAAPPTAARRVAPATIALVLAGLLLIATAAIAIFRSGEEDAAAGNEVAAPPAPSMDSMAASLQQRLRQDPDNHEAWFRLGMTWRGAGRFREAEQAFRRAVELAPRNADYTAYLGEVLLILGGDSPPPEATTLFRRALEIAPGNPQARYYLATIKDVNGDHRGALDDLIALLRDAPAGAAWEAQVRGAATGIAARNRIDVAGRLPPPRAPAPSSATAAIPGPSREQMEAARGIPPGQQDQMGRSMTERLAARLRQNPRDADGWIQLMRSRMVLHEPDAAAAALRSGLAAFAGDAATQARLREAARELGVPG
ncbi:MAG: cytochrome c-type biosis protein CcmH [Sphingomonadales bacterium]|jgi:cytochrome c-type biogenesis protein CcmH|nr:cytochrome c-type biosis protein CcmH [Sphingomonadales bacterium]